MGLENQDGSDPNPVTSPSDIFKRLSPALQVFAVSVGLHRPDGRFTEEWIKNFVEVADLHPRDFWRNFRHLITFEVITKGDDGGYHLYDEDSPERLIPDITPSTKIPVKKERRPRVTDNYFRKSDIPTPTDTVDGNQAPVVDSYNRPNIFEQNGVISVGSCSFDPHTRLFDTGNYSVELTSFHSSILEILMRSSKPVSVEELIAKLTIENDIKTPYAMARAINFLLKEIEENPARPTIITEVPGEGFLFNG